MKINIEEKEHKPIEFMAFSWYLAEDKKTKEKVLLFIASAAAEKYTAVFQRGIDGGMSHYDFKHIERTYTPLENVYDRLEISLTPKQ